MGPAGASVGVCTLATKSFLGRARALALSLRDFHPECRLQVLLADRPDGVLPTSADEPFDLVPIDALENRDAVERMSFYYDAFEFCNGLRGELHAYMWEKTDHAAWLYLDSDVMVTGRLDAIFEELSRCSILLSPHCRSPVPLDAVDPHELNLIRNGTFNSGFLGMRRTPMAKQFLDWFRTRLHWYAFNGHDRELRALKERFVSGLFVDQVWLDLAPLYFDDVAFLEDRGANLAHWNLFERPLRRAEDGGILAAGAPVKFVHFSGWDASEPQRISHYAPMYEQGGGVDATTRELWTELSLRYRDLLGRARDDEARRYAYGYDRYHGGGRISAEDRLRYYHLCKEGNAPPGDPFRSPAALGGSPSARLARSLRRWLERAVGRDARR